MATFRPNSLTGVDTNVIVRALTNDDEKQSPAAQEALSGFTVDDPGFVSQVTLAEIYWLLRNTYRLDKGTVLAALRGLIETETLEFDDAESIVRALTLAEEGADFADALIHSAGELFGTTQTVTFDRRAAAHLGWQLLDP